VEPYVASFLPRFVAIDPPSSISLFTRAALAANPALVFAGLASDPCHIRRSGAAVAKAVAEVASLFLAAIAVAMIRAGIVGSLAASAA
jgi:multiple antibiotic resistance protein